MSSASPAVCLRCGVMLPPEGGPCAACLLAAGQSPDSAAEELMRLALRLPPPERENFLDEAGRQDPALAAGVRQRLEYRPVPARGPAPSTESASDIERSDETPGVWIGAFRLVRCLGEGGMGTVWEAEQQAPVRRTVALKLIKLGMDTREVVKRFDRERQTLALLNHPNIAQVFEAGVTPSGRPYFVMEKVTGCPITEACTAGRLDRKARLALFLEICAAVEHAHQKGVIHRDLKPSNILVGEGRVKVIDFGVAKATRDAGDSLFTLRAQILGTPAYMSPEQAQSAGTDLDTRTDVYALGGILYELLVGVPPFDSERLARTSLVEMQRILLEEDPPAPSVRLAALRMRTVRGAPDGIRPSELRGDLDRVVLKALRKDRDERYPSAAALAEDLRRHLAGKPVTAVPPTLGYRLGKFVRRHRTAVAGAVLTLAAMISGLVVSVQQAARARHAQRIATLTVADMQTRSGLAADAADDPSRAALWFANAAVIAGGDPTRRDANLRRAAAWRQTLPTPVRALDTGFPYVGELLWNPRRPALIVESQPTGHCQIWDLSADQLWTAGTNPPPSRALWDSSGDHVVIATGSELQVLNFTVGRELARLESETPDAWAVDPRGDWIAIGTIRPLLWNWRSGQRHPLPVRDQPPNDLRFSANGRRLLMAWHESAGIVSMSDPGVLLHEPVANAPQGEALFLGEGDRYVTSAPDGRVQIRDSDQGRVLKEFPAPGLHRGFPLVASPDGRFLVRQSVAALDLTGGTVPAVPVHQNIFQAAAFSPDGSVLATGGYDDALKLWDLPADRLVSHVGHHQHSVLCVAVSPDARFVASSQDGFVRIWQIARPSPRTTIAVDADSLAVLSREGRFLAPSGFNRRQGALARTGVRELPSGNPAGPVLDPGGLIMDAGFHPDTRWLALAVSTAPDREHTHFETEHGSGNVQLWDFRAGVRVGSPIPLPSEPRSLAIHPSGDWIAILCGGGQALEYSLTSNSMAARFRFKNPHPPDATLHNGKCAYSEDGRWLGAWGLNDGFFVWDRDKACLRVEPIPGSGTVFDVDFQGSTVVSARMSQASSLDFRDLSDGAQSTPSIPYSNWPFLAQFHPRGIHLLTTGRDRVGQVWDWRRGQRVGPALPHKDEVMAGAFVSERPWVVTGGHDGRIQTWEYPSGMPAGPDLALPGAILSLQFSPDGRTLIACGSLESRIELYDWRLLFPEATLDPDGARLLAELDASAIINADGGLIPLNAEEWLARWKEFRTRYPGFPGHAVAPGAAP